LPPTRRCKRSSFEASVSFYTWCLNIRDISVPLSIRKEFLYCSGAFRHITPAGESSLAKQYRICTIFDLRSLAERNSRPSPHIEGIETRWIPSTTDARILRLKNEDPKDFIEEDGKGYLKVYSNLLESYKDAFREVLFYLRDEKESEVLFHCTSIAAHQASTKRDS
jgi:hypothetical protein